MPEDSDLYKVSVDLGLGQAPGPQEAREERPFDILVVGDFTGRASRGVMDPDGALRGAPLIGIDADNVLSMGGLVPRLELAGSTWDPSGSGPGGGLQVRLEFRHTEDFHPDRLIAKVPGLLALRSRRYPGAQSGEAPTTGLDAILDATLGSTPSLDSVGRDGLAAFAERVVSGHLVPGEDPAAQAFRTRMDEVTATLLGRLLHHPRFQELEALWRSLVLLVARSGPDAHLRVHLVDVSKAELLADAHAHRAVRDSGLIHSLVEARSERTPGGRWALAVGAFSFEPTSDDLALLFHLAAASHLAGIPWMSAAGPTLSGFTWSSRPPERTRETVHPAWEAFRGSGFASGLGLAAPGFLTRVPYGQESDPIETFCYEEVRGEPAHDEYLWGNPAFLVAALWAEAYRAREWRLVPEHHLEVAGLPLHIPRGAGGPPRGCAEALLTDREAGAMLDRGIMPVRSIAGTDRVRLAGMSSVARPPTPLAAWWRGV